MAEALASARLEMPTKWPFPAAAMRGSTVSMVLASPSRFTSKVRVCFAIRSRSRNSPIPAA